MTVAQPILHKGKGGAGYWVVEGPTDNPKDDGPDAMLYEVRWLGSDKSPPVATFTMCESGSRLTFHPNPLLAHNPKVQADVLGWLYNDAMRGVMLAMGPGFGAELVLLRWGA